VPHRRLLYPAPLREMRFGFVWRQRLSGRRVRSCLCPCKDRAMLAELRLVPYGQEKSRLRHRLMEQLTESTIQGSFDFVDELHV